MQRLELALLHDGGERRPPCSDLRTETAAGTAGETGLFDRNLTRSSTLAASVTVVTVPVSPE